MFATDQVSEAWADWLTTFNFDAFATYTFAPKENRVIGQKGAFRLQRKYFGQFDSELIYFSVAEKHKWRDDVHLHTMLKFADKGITRNKMWRNWEQGRSRILPLNDKGVSYCAKYLQKQRDVPIDFKLK